MDLLSGDLGIMAVLGAGIAGAALAIILDFSPDRRRRRGAADTQRLQ